MVVSRFEYCYEIQFIPRIKSLLLVASWIPPYQLADPFKCKLQIYFNKNKSQSVFKCFIYCQNVMLHVWFMWQIISRDFCASLDLYTELYLNIVLWRLRTFKYPEIIKHTNWRLRDPIYIKLKKRYNFMSDPFIFSSIIFDRL